MTMRQYIQKIATGPELSKDLSREEARDGMRLILSGDADPVQAAIFLIALRMKRETMPENLGVLDALLDQTRQATTTGDGCLRHPFFRQCSLPAVWRRFATVQNPSAQNMALPTVKYCARPGSAST